MIGKYKMERATFDFLQHLDELGEKRKSEILRAGDHLHILGNIYYVSQRGSDENDGKTPNTPWKTLKKVSEADLKPNDGVLFCRGDLFRGLIKTKLGVTYAAYGIGEKPKFYGWDKSLADPDLWKQVDVTHHIWKLAEPILDCGTLVFNEGEKYCRKLIPSYIHSEFVCRDDESRPFDMAAEMTEDLDLFCSYTAETTEIPSKGENFPIPVMNENSFGDLYLRCDAGNPGNVFRSVEALPRRSMIQVGDHAHVTIDNLCLKYIGVHAIAAGGSVVGLHVSNCEIGWIGGTIQHYAGTDPNYPQGKRGSVTRFGNGVEIYGSCEDYSVTNCYIYQVYDAGITHQVTTNGRFHKMTDIRYCDNLIEYCVYSIEYFLEKTNGDTKSYISDCEISGNILRFSGYGWGQQRHNKDTPAHIKSWSYENTARNYSIHDNVFDRAAYRMVHLVATEPESCPVMYRNTYVMQLGGWLGQYGANQICEPDMLVFDCHAEEKIDEVLHDRNAKAYYVE